MSRIKAVFVSLYHCSLAVLNIYLLDLIFTTNPDVYLSAVPVALVMGIAQMGASGVQMIQQDAAKKAAVLEAGRLGKSIANRRFVNKFAALQAPTKGTEMLMERVMRQAQASTEASKEAGARGVIGGTGRTVQGVADAGAQITARLDDLQLKLDNKFLTEEQRIGLMNEKKNLQLDYQRLIGAQGAAAAAQTASNQALGSLISGAGSAIAGGIEASDLYKGGEEIDITDTASTTDTVTKDFVENDQYSPNLIPNPDMDTLKIAEPPVEYQMQVNAPGLSMDPADITQKMKAQGRSDAQINYLLEDPSSFEEYLKTLQ
jgi:hypothetical protein